MADLADPNSVVRRIEYCSEVIKEFHCIGATKGGTCFPGKLRFSDPDTRAGRWPAMSNGFSR